MTNFAVRLGGCSGVVAGTGTTLTLRENLVDACLELAGTGLGGVTAAGFKVGGAPLATGTVGTVSANTARVTVTIPPQVLGSTVQDVVAVETCLSAGATDLGCVGGLYVSGITASPGGMAGALGSATSPVATVSAAVALAGVGSRIQLLGDVPWGATDVLTLPASAQLRGGPSTLDGQGSTTRQLVLGGGSSVSQVTFRSFGGFALAAGTATAASVASLDSVSVSLSAGALDVNGGHVALAKGTTGDCVVRDGTGEPQLSVRGGGTLRVEGCTLTNNQGDAVLAREASTVEFTGVTGTSHIPTLGAAGDDDGFLVLDGATADVTASQLSGSQRSAIVVKGTGNTLRVRGSTTFSMNGTTGQSYCAGIALLGDGTTTIERQMGRTNNQFTDTCAAIYRSPTANNVLTVSDSDFLRSWIEVRGNLGNVNASRITVTNAPTAAGLYFDVPDTGPLMVATIADSTIAGSAGHGAVFFGKLSANFSKTSSGTCAIRGSARSGLYAARSVVQSVGCTFENNGWWGVALEGTVTSPRAEFTNATITGNGGDGATATGGVLVRNTSARFSTSPITANDGYGVRLDAQGVTSVIPDLTLEGAGPIAGNSGAGLEAAAGTVTSTFGPDFADGGTHAIHLMGATSFTSTGVLRLRNNAGDGLRVDRAFGANVSIGQFSVEGNGGAGVHLTGGPAAAAISGTVTLASGSTTTAVRRFAQNAGGHIVDDQPASLTAPLNASWTVSVGTNPEVAGPRFIDVGSKWTQVIVDGATITRASTPAVGTISSTRFGASAPSERRIKLTGTITQNGTPLALPTAVTCGPLQTFLPQTGTGMAPFLDLNGTGDCIEP